MFQMKYAVWDWSDWPPIPSSCDISVPWRKTKWPFELQQPEKENNCNEEKSKKAVSCRKIFGDCFKGLPISLLHVSWCHETACRWGQESRHKKPQGLDYSTTWCRENMVMSPSLPSMWVQVTKHTLKFLLFALRHPTVESKGPERTQWCLPC